MQNADLAEKQTKSAFSVKDYVLPSGKVINCQGYEPFALDKLINEDDVDEDDIVTAKSEVPEIWYVDAEGVDRRYYMDIFLKSQNKSIEVKSVWTFSQNQDLIFRKHNAVKEAGYGSEIWVFNNKGIIVEFHD